MTKKEKRKEIYKYLTDIGVDLDSKFNDEYISNEIKRLLKEYEKTCLDIIIKQLEDKDKAIAKLKRYTPTRKPTKKPVQHTKKKVYQKPEPIKNYDLSDVKPVFYIK